ncbi:MAG: hypothetical protein ACRC8Y_07025 [Chroococcales cyanobacterium]
MDIGNLFGYNKAILRLIAMISNTYQLPLTFEQILILVQQLPQEEQIKLKQEIDKRINAREEGLLTVLDRIGKNAQQKGLTEEILQELLADES